jgi:hypothetical protein
MMAVYAQNNAYGEKVSIISLKRKVSRHHGFQASLDRRKKLSHLIIFRTAK